MQKFDVYYISKVFYIWLPPQLRRSWQPGGVPAVAHRLGLLPLLQPWLRLHLPGRARLRLPRRWPQEGRLQVRLGRSGGDAGAQATWPTGGHRRPSCDKVTLKPIQT